MDLGQPRAIQRQWTVDPGVKPVNLAGSAPEMGGAGQQCATGRDLEAGCSPDEHDDETGLLE